MIIKLEDVNNRKGKPIFVGSRRRLATATGVALLDSKHFVVTGLKAQRMYLLQFDLSQGTYSTISCIRTEYNGNEIRTDLLDWDGRAGTH